ncbi:MAG: hypothetical protein RID42_14610 [Alphaproteobacteria bacterium]
MSKRVRARIRLWMIAGIAVSLLGIGSSVEAGPVAEASALTMSGFVGLAPVDRGDGNVLTLQDGSVVVPVAHIREAPHYEIVASIVSPQSGRNQATLEYVREVKSVEMGQTDLLLRSQDLSARETVRLTICVK